MDPMGLRLTQTTCFSISTHAKQLSLVTFCETTAGIRKKWKCDVRTDVRTYGRTDRREVWNSYLDLNILTWKCNKLQSLQHNYRPLYRLCFCIHFQHSRYLSLWVCFWLYTDWKGKKNVNYLEVPASQVPPRSAKSHNCLGLSLVRIINVGISDHVRTKS